MTGDHPTETQPDEPELGPSIYDPVITRGLGLWTVHPEGDTDPTHAIVCHSAVLASIWRKGLAHVVERYRVGWATAPQKRMLSHLGYVVHEVIG